MANHVIEAKPYVNVDDWKISEALLALRGGVERELLRHCWCARESLVPVAIYASATCRALAMACDGRWGDLDAARRALSAEMYLDLLRTIADLPSRELDFCLRALALTSTPGPSNTHVLTKALRAKEARRAA
jgi:hypothetical protein